jgi:ATP-dependent protease HslVU (ClpYQ) peptidase subunit
MTCIVGLIDKEKNRVVIGGDSAGSNGFRYEIVANPKVFRVEDFLIGGTTSFRMLQLLQFSLRPPDFHYGFQCSISEVDIYEYMCTKFVKALKKAMRDGGFLSKDQIGRDQGGELLVGYKDRLFCIQNDFQVQEYADGFFSVGSGATFALGAIKGMLLTGKKFEPEAIVESALITATHFAVGVKPPFVILSTASESD